MVVMEQRHVNVDHTSYGRAAGTVAVMSAADRAEYSRSGSTCDAPSALRRSATSAMRYS